MHRQSFSPVVVDKRQAEIVSSVPKHILIGGLWQPAEDGNIFLVENPASGALLAEIANATPRDGMRALAAAEQAQTQWAAEPPRYRGEILRKAFELLTRDKDEFALLISMEMGKSLSEARSEVAYAAEFLRWFSEEAVRIHGRYQKAPDGATRQIISKNPVGPCLMVTPWNFPLAMMTRKVGPAIAAGCTMVVKPAEMTPLSALRFAELMMSAGLPDGVLNVVPTTNASILVSGLLGDRRLKKLSFTGSTRVGRILLAASAKNILRTSMELGGNAPFIIFSDADLNAAVEGAVQSKLRNIGQACTAANRFYVHASVAREFVEKLARRFEEIGSGQAALTGDGIGPLISDQARHDVHALVKDAIACGATVETGGILPDGAGYFYPPTVLSNVPATAGIMQMEAFGPVAPIMAFTEESEAIALANDSDYGLAAYAYTQNLDRVLRLQDQLQVGMLGVNTGMISDPAAPFGGIKHSGLGREGGMEGIDEYLITKYTALASPSEQA